MITCLSDLYYKIGWWFTIIMFIIAVVTLPFVLDTWDSIWSFLMCGGIAFVGAAPNFKGSDHDIHYYSAATSALCSVIWTANVMPECFYSIFAGLALTILDNKRWLLYSELTCFIMVYIALIIGG